jgi:hypothetical protein
MVTQGAGGTIQVSNGALFVRNFANQIGGALFQSSDVFDLTNSTLTVDIINGGPQGGSRETALNLFPNSVGLVRGMALYQAANKIYAQYFYNGFAVIGADVTFAGSVPLPLKLRFRASGTSIVAEYSTGSGWLEVGTVPNAFGGSLQDLKMSLASTCYVAATCMDGTSTFDNLNLP